ncbi:phage major capsid protein, HK97 family [Clostridium acidisoli DSM 12555]|uniref:Phage major capsid protein, HK97 family n=1 Tax=Clostridium acidisoli DSM 12555 TaxID=1121291 RepID=A0A1W1X5X1_9CLOT|nr:phage major capsid protein [Clostridium acidisoli]SMC19326.1 phage major capsid protein, HK97 family [Clostridium acidisoli DSM 12555]
MSKLEELRGQLDAKKVEIRGFLDEKKADEAEKATVEKRNLEKLITIQVELDADEKRDLESQKNKKKEVDKTMAEVSEMRAIVKKIMGQETTVEERDAITTADNSAVLPKEFINNLMILQKGYGSLKSLCDIVPVHKNEGTIPVIDLDQNTMSDVLEGADIVDGTLVTTDIPFTVSKVGLIQTLTSELLDDAEIEIESLVNSNFLNIATVKENVKILKVLTDNATAVAGTPIDYSAVENAIDSALPSVKSGLVTITNVDGYVALKNMKDKQGRNLNLITVDANGVEYFHSKPIVYVEDTLLPIVTTDKTQIFYIANTKEAIKFCDRNQVTIARSTEAGFNDDTVKVRILERFGVVKGSVRSIKRIEY